MAAFELMKGCCQTTNEHTDYIHMLEYQVALEITMKIITRLHFTVKRSSLVLSLLLISYNVYEP
jgi:hypothetical protein